MNRHKLRPYQQQAVDEIKELYSQGYKKVLLHCATGAGKTTVFAHIMESAAKKEKNIVLAVRGRKLVDQAHKRLLAQGVEHGVLMANHKHTYPLAKVKVCSIDTVNARQEYPPADLVVVDEAHYAVSDSFKKFAAQYPDAFFLSVTATPYVDKSIEHVATKVVKPISMQEVIDIGYLVPPVYYAPMTPDLSTLKVSRTTKDYVVKDMDEKFGDSSIIKDVVGNWKKYSQSRPTLGFAVSVRHSKSLTEMFNEAGVPAEHCDADTPEAERNAIIKRLEYGTTKIIFNVGIFCTGVDIPVIGCVLMARPTKSYNLYIQQAGRGTRLAEGKNDFILLDCVGNVMKHGFIVDEPEASIDGKKKQEDSAPKIKTCPKCFNVMNNFVKECEECGHIFGLGGGGEREIASVDKDLVPMSELTEMQRAEIRFTQLKKQQKDRGYKKGWIYHQLKEQFSEEVAQKLMPPRKVPDWVVKKYDTFSINK